MSEFAFPSFTVPLNGGETLYLRRAMPRDARIVSRILLDAKREKDRQGDNVWELRSFDPEWAGQEIERVPTYIGEVGETGEPALTFSLTTGEDSVWGEHFPEAGASLHKLASSESMRGRNLAQPLITTVARRLAEAGFSHLCIDLPRENERLEAFYVQRMKFERPPIHEADIPRADPDNTLPEYLKYYYARLLWLPLQNSV